MIVLLFIFLCLAAVTGVTATADSGVADLEDDDAAPATGAEGDDEGGHEEFIPYARFKKANEDLNLTRKQYEALQADFDSVKEFKDFIDDLRAEGLTNSDDVRAFVTKQTAGSLGQQRTAAEAKAVQDYHRAVADGHDPDMALRAYNLDMREAKVRYEDALLRQRETAAGGAGNVSKRVKAAIEKYPEADEDVLRKLASIPGTNIEAEAKALHDKELSRQVNYAKKKTTQTGTRGSGTREGANAAPSSAGPPPDALKDPVGARKWVQSVLARNSK